MKTPAGKECHYYYEDFNRGRNRQECRLLHTSQQMAWRPADCTHCPVPDILWANASPDLVLKASVNKGFLGFGRHIHVTAICKKHDIVIDDPFVGCRQCAKERPNLADLLEGKDP
jgi:hypothetical protein